MTNLTDYRTQQQAAADLLRSGDLGGSIALQTRLVEDMLANSPAAVQAEPALRDLLEEAANALVDALRWNRDYEPAIALQERLQAYLPESAEILRLGVANLRLEAGQEAEGLAELHGMVENDPENFWFQLSLASGYLWAQNLDEAEAVLRRAAEMSHVRKVDRALAQQYLFDLYGRKGDMDSALLAWREAGRLDSKLRVEMLPAVCRMLVYWRKYGEAGKHIAMLGERPRRLFYEGLLAWSEGRHKDANVAWRSLVVEYAGGELNGGEDEYAEACLRLVTPSNAIGALEPLVSAGQNSYYRLVLLGLAYAQRQDLARARQYLEIAMRLGDLDRPRKTRPGPVSRIFDIHARLLYGDMVLDVPVRAALDPYFLPKAQAA